MENQEQVGWVYTYPDASKNITPVLSLHKLDNKLGWIGRPIYTSKIDQYPRESDEK